VSNCQRGVHHQKAADPIWTVHWQGQPQQPVPILHHQCDIMQIEPVNNFKQNLTVKVKPIGPIFQPVKVGLWGAFDSHRSPQLSQQTCIL
jgi:hypothetical protein